MAEKDKGLGFLDLFKKGARPAGQAAAIRTSELSGAGISIQKDDPRLKGGITLENLSKIERSKLLKFRGSQ